MAKASDRYRRLYDALRNYQAAGATFTISDLSTATKYKKSALAVYFGNRLRNVHVFTSDGVNYTSRGVTELSYDQFLEYMSQKSEKVRKLDLETILVEKSFEAFYLALELYNKPILTYKAESFLVLIVNAWELLFKSLIVRIHGEDALYYDPTMSRTLSITDCINKMLADPKDVVRRNLEMVVQLRDQAAHLVIPELQNTLSRLFQANVLNYVRTVEIYNIRNPLPSRSMGLLSLVVDVKDADRETIRLTYGSRLADRVDQFLERFTMDEVELSSSFYAVPITYRFILSNRAAEGDIEISLTEDGTTARIVEIPKDPDKTHPFRLTQLLHQVNAGLEKAGKPPLNRADILSVVASEKVRSDKVNKYHYRADNPETHKYSPEFAELILRKLVEHKEYLASCRARYAEAQRRRRVNS